MRRSLSDKLYIVSHCPSTSLWPAGRSASKFYATYHADTKISSQKRYIMSLDLYNTNALRLWFFGLRKTINKNPIKYLVNPITFIHSPILIQNSYEGYSVHKMNQVICAIHPSEQSFETLSAWTNLLKISYNFFSDLIPHPFNSTKFVQGFRNL